MIRTIIAAACLATAAAISTAAVAGAQPFENCKVAASAGMYDIPSDSPYYGPWLDRDHDGIGCES